MPALTKTRLCYPSLLNVSCCKIAKPGISIAGAQDTMRGLLSLMRYPASLHPSLEHLPFFSVSPAALSLQPSKRDQASKCHKSLSSLTDPSAWPMARCDHPSVTSCFTSPSLGARSSGWGVVLLSSPRFQDKIYIVQRPDPQLYLATVNFFLLISLEGETSFLLFIK